MLAREERDDAFCDRTTEYGVSGRDGLHGADFRIETVGEAIEGRLHLLATP